MIRARFHARGTHVVRRGWLVRCFCLASTILVFPVTTLGAPNDVILNEYNGVSSRDYLDSNTSSKADDTFGRIEGNGQNWLEFLIVKDHLDLRGFVAEWEFDDSPNTFGSGTLTFSQDAIWSDLRQGTLLTVTEWQEAWYNDKNTASNNFSRAGGVNGLGNDRGDKYDPLKHERFVDFSTDTAWSPEVGDFHMNIQSGQRNPATGDFRYFSLSGTINDLSSNTTFTVGVDNDAGVFAVNNQNWALTIKDSMASVVQGPIGESVLGSNLGVNSNEVGKFEGAFDNTLLGFTGTVAQYKNTAIGDYDDGDQSTFGKKNRGGGFEQGLAGLRTWFNAANVIRRNTTTSGLAFNNNSAWLGGSTPGLTQEAVFDQGSAVAYTIAVSVSDGIQRLLVRNDKVGFDLNGNTLTINADQEYEASVIGQTSGDLAQLTVLGGGVLKASVIHVAEQAGSSGDLTVNGSGTNLSLSQALIVGGRASTPGGAGSVTVAAGATLVISSSDANVRETLKVFSDGTLTTTGGAMTVGSGSMETVPGTLRIHPDGNLDVRGGTLVATTIQLSGGAISGYGTISSEVVASAASNVFVPQFDNGLEGQLTFLGSISGASVDTLTKRGGGTLLLDNSNTYTGTTTISDGLLQADDGAGLPSASTLRFRGGRLQTSGTFSRSLGSGAGQVNWSDATDGGEGGFSARGGNLIVNLGGAAAPVTWGAGNFVPDGEVLRFNSNDADAQVQFVNPIDLGTAGSHTREIRVANNGSSSDDLAVLAGVLSSSGGTQGINKVSAGILQLIANNTYNGATTINNGQLRAVDGVGLPAGSTLRLRGGILESQGTLLRNLGTGSGQLNWIDANDDGDGGFAALDGTLHVTIGGGANLTWNVGGFVPTGRDLLFNSETADDAVTLHNPIDLGNFQRTVRVFDNSDSSSDQAVMSGVLSGTGGIEKKGNGELELSAANLYTGPTSVDNGRFTMTGSVTSTVTVGIAGAVSGNGTVVGDLVNRGTHAVRDVETLAVSGTATLDPASQLAVTENYSQTRATETGNFPLLTSTIGITGQFATPAGAGVASHLGNGYFLRAIQHDPRDVTINILAAAKGDGNGDYDVDFTDFNILASNFDPSGDNGPYGWTDANFDGDYDVDFTDFNSLATNFSPSGYPSLAQSVPEPVGALLWAMAVLILCGGRSVWQ